MSIRDYVGDRASNLFTSEVKCSCPTGTKGGKMEVVGVDEWKHVAVTHDFSSAGNGLSSDDAIIPRPGMPTTSGVNEGEGDYHG